MKIFFQNGRIGILLPYICEGNGALIKLKSSYPVVMQSLLTDNIDKIWALCINNNVKSLYAFGSVCTDKFDEKSDVDFLVSFKNIELLKYADNYFDFKFSLEELLNRPVDLIEEMAMKNPYFIEAVNESKKIIYGS